MPSIGDMTSLRAGVACVDITPNPGLHMSGYAARTQAATGAHDPLTVRALVINDTALIVCDVIGMHEEMSSRIRHNAALPAENIVITALHNHGAPASMAGRLSEPANPDFLDTLEFACVSALAQAIAEARPCTLRSGYGEDPDIARNRRQSNGVVDTRLPVLMCVDEEAVPFAILISYACHPVVLGADNLLYTADYPHFVRAHLESQLPGCTALFSLGAAADINSGHTASASITVRPQADRTFLKARQIGQRIADCALRADMRICSGQVVAVNRYTELVLKRREQSSNKQLIRLWTTQKASAEPGQAALLDSWIRWAERFMTDQENSPIETLWPARVTLLQWGQILLFALPGEQFASVALQLRQQAMHSSRAWQSIFVLSLAEGNPGYICPDNELAVGGYEPDEAHRYYGMPASFASGSVDRLTSAAHNALIELS